MPEGIEVLEPSTATGKRRRSSDGKKPGAKKRRKSQGDVDSPPDEPTPGSKSVESSPASKMSPSIRAKRGSFEGFEQEDIHIVSHETRSTQGKKLSPETSTAFSTASPTVSSPSTTAVSASGTGVASSSAPLQESPSRNRRTQREPTPPPTALPQIGSSPSRKGQPSSEAGGTSPLHLSSTRSRRNAPEPSTDPVQQPPSSTDQDTGSNANSGVPTVENLEAISRRQPGSAVHLDTSVESLPSVTSLHSPTSESFHSADDDPTSPRKEKRHRDGSKKKKKDKDKELEGGRKRKKHHHREKHGLGEMASEMVTPVRIKVCNKCSLN